MATLRSPLGLGETAELGLPRQPLTWRPLEVETCTHSGPGVSSLVVLGSSEGFTKCDAAAQFGLASAP